MIEIEERGTIWYIKAKGKPIGTIHIGHEGNPDDEDIININLNPRFHESKYLVQTVRTDTVLGTVYICLEVPKSP